MHRRPARRLLRRAIRPLCGAAIVAFGASGVSAQTSLTGAGMALKSTGSATLNSNGYLGTYLTIPAGGATINFTINASRGASGAGDPHLNLAIADTLSGFTVANTSATNYTTPNITLPAGTYFVRNERDYSGNVGVTRSFTVNHLSVNAIAGGAATFVNTTDYATNRANALNAADTYINHFRMIGRAHV